MPHRRAELPVPLPRACARFDARTKDLELAPGIQAQYEIKIRAATQRTESAKLAEQGRARKQALVSISATQQPGPEVDKRGDHLVIQIIPAKAEMACSACDFRIR